MRKRKTYTSQFKREAVRLMESSEKLAFDVTPQLGVRRNQLYKWKEQLDTRCAEAFPGAGRQKGQVDELSRLRQESAKAKEEHDILKKAAAYFAKELG
jgi:transposase